MLNEVGCVHRDLAWGEGESQRHIHWLTSMVVLRKLGRLGSGRHYHKTCVSGCIELEFPMSGVCYSIIKHEFELVVYIAYPLYFSSLLSKLIW